MILHPIIDDLKKLRLAGAIEALESQMKNPESKNLTFEERLALLIDNELIYRENKKLSNRLKKAKFKQNACMQDVDYKSPRGLSRSFFMSFENCQWIRSYRNILITGATGTGKSYLGEALAHNACIKGFTAIRLHLSKFFNHIEAAKADGSYSKHLAEMVRCDLLLIDDFGAIPLTSASRRDLLEIIDDRYNTKSTIITSQLPVVDWHEAIGDKTLADAILDRLVHNAYRIELKGESMRKLQASAALSNQKECYELVS